jgi:hypothetical protein
MGALAQGLGMEAAEELALPLGMARSLAAGFAALPPALARRGQGAPGGPPPLARQPCRPHRIRRQSHHKAYRLPRQVLRPPQVLPLK